MNTDETKPDLSRLIDAGHRPARRGFFYSRFVVWARVGLPLIALGITGIALTWTDRRAPLKTIEQISPPAGQATAMQNELISPRFQNTDDQGRPYTLTAARAFQDEHDKNRIMLESPSGDMAIDSDRWAALKAKNGVFDQTFKTLALQNDVTLFYTGGYEIRSENVLLDMAAGTAKTDTPVTGIGPDMALNATGMNGNAKTGVLILKGPARVEMNIDTSGKGIF